MNDYAKKSLSKLTARQVIGVARTRVCARHPYFSDLLWRLRLVEAPGHGTMSVDEGLRLFYDPAEVVKWGAEHTPTVLAHEVQHIRRRHHVRSVPMRTSGVRYEYDRKRGNVKRVLGCDSFEMLLNYAWDLEINDDVRRAGWVWPEGFKPLQVEDFNLEPGKAGEFYARALLASIPEDNDDQSQSEPQRGGAQSRTNPGAQSQSGDDERESGQGEGESGEGVGEGDGGEEVDAPADEDERDSEGRDGEGDASPDEDGEGDAAQDGSEPSGNGGQGSRGDAGDAGDGGAGGASEGVATGRGRCGGCAGHTVGREKELGPDTPERASQDEVDSTLVRVADAVRNWKGGPGKGVAPGNSLMEWAQSMFSPPKLDPMALLQKHVRVAVAAAQCGTTRRVWDAPNRRREVLKRIGWGKRAPLLPAYRGHRPRVVIVLDRSGSMGWGEGSRAARVTNEALGFVKAAQGDAFGIAVDSRVQSAVPVRCAADLLKLNKGGGGTDMRVGVRAAADPKLKADLIILLTDGETDWLTAREMPKQRVLTVVVSERDYIMKSLPKHFRDHAVYVPTQDDKD